jgi:hypothetical protein
MPTGAIIGGIGSAVGGIASAWGASNAADAQRDAANQANARLESQYKTNAANLAPWMQGGADASGLVNFLTGASSEAPTWYNGEMGGRGALTAGFAPTMAQLEQTPGYQFIKNQGLKTVQNSYAAKGLGSSGAALKGAADYISGPTGIASTNYQQQFQNYWNQNKSIYDMLTGQSNVGANAAAALASGGNALASGISANTIGAGNAQAAASNAIGGAVGNTANSIAQYGLLSNYMSNGTAGTQAPWSGGMVGVGDYQMPTVGYNAYGY